MHVNGRAFERGSQRGSCQRTFSVLAAAATVLLLISTGCVGRTVVIESKPSGANAFVDGVDRGATPCKCDLTWNKEEEVHTIEVRLPEYERQSRTLSQQAAKEAPKPWVQPFELLRLEHPLEVPVETDPPGAMITVDGRRVGPAPLTVPIRFARATSTSPWSRAKISAELSEYFTAQQELSYGDAAQGRVSLRLVRARHELPVNVVCNVPGAEIVVDDKLVGQAPLRPSFVFTRRDAASPWSTFLVTVSKDGFRWQRPTGVAPAGDTTPFTVTLTYDQALSGELKVDLEPIRFVWTILRYYRFDGDQVGIAEERVLAQVGEAETEPMVQSVTRMTDCALDELMDTRVWVAAPEQQLVYSVPFVRPEVRGQLSNLWRQVGQGLTRLTDGPVADIEASVSSDGQFCYFAANRLRPDKVSLWRVRMTGQGGFTKITDSPSSMTDTEPMASPDGTRIAYASKLRGSEVWHIWIANADGTLPTQLRAGQSPAWSPDNNRLVYIAKDDDNFSQVWVMNADASRPTQLTTGRAQHASPLWTPDGKRIVYASNESINAEGVPNFDIWIMNADGMDRTQLTVNGSWDGRPAISPDGQHIYFLSNRGAKRTMENYWQIWRIQLK
jgi:hypothetical protein